MTRRTYYPSVMTVSKDAADKAKRDRFHEASFLAALQGLCANPWFSQNAFTVFEADKSMTLVQLSVQVAKATADAALDQYPFITDDEQLTKGKTQ